MRCTLSNLVVCFFTAYIVSGGGVSSILLYFGKPVMNNVKAFNNVNIISEKLREFKINYTN